MKRILSVVLCLVFALSLCAMAAGCKSTQENTPSEGGEFADRIPGGVADVGVEVLEALTNSGEVSSYVFTSSDTFYGGSLGGLNNASFQRYFEEVYGGTLSLNNIEWEGWESKFVTDFAANEAPDLIYGMAKLWPKIANRGMVLTRQELVDQGVLGLDHPLLEEGRETADDNFTYKNQPFSVALLGSSCFWCVVNEDLYKQYNVKSPSQYYEEGLWSFDTLAESSTKLITAAGLGDSGVREIFGYYCWDSTVLVRANGQQLIGIDKKTGNITNNIEKPEVMSCLELLRTAFQDGWATKNNTFARGKVGIIAAADGNIDEEVMDASFEWSIIPYPKGNNNQNGQIPGSCNAWMVTSSSDNPQGAINLVIAYIAAYNDTTFNPPSDDPALLENILKDRPETRQMMKDNLAKGVNDNMYGVGSLWSAQWDFWNAVRHGKQTVSETVQTYKSMFDAQIEAELEYAE